MPKVGSEGTTRTQYYPWIRNSENEAVVLCLEPWANEISLSNGSDYLVLFEGPKGQFPVVEWSRDRITVHGWSGSVAWVLQKGQIVLSCTQPVPPVPAGLNQDWDAPD